MQMGVPDCKLLELNFGKVAFFGPSEAGEDSICTIFSINDFVTVSINVRELFRITVQPGLHFHPPILEFGFQTIINSGVCENFSLRC